MRRLCGYTHKWKTLAGNERYPHRVSFPSSILPSSHPPSKVVGISSKQQHYDRRTDCITKFVEFFGRDPLVYSKVKVGGLQVQ
jgi:hypothetical protein